MSRQVVVESEDHNLIEVRTRLGIGSFSPVVFVPVGLAIAGFSVRAMITGSASAEKLIFPTIFGILFLAAGVFGTYRSLRQSGMIFDRAARSLSKWTGFLGPKRWEDIPFDSIDRIQVRYIPSRGEHSSSSIDADLILKDGRRLCIYSGKHMDALDIAFQLSAHTGLDVEDLSPQTE